MFQIWASRVGMIAILSGILCGFASDQCVGVWSVGAGDCNHIRRMWCVGVVDTHSLQNLDRMWE